MSGIITLLAITVCIMFAVPVVVVALAFFMARG